MVSTARPHDPLTEPGSLLSIKRNRGRAGSHDFQIPGIWDLISFPPHPTIFLCKEHSVCGWLRGHPGTLLHSCPQGEMLTTAGFRPPGRPGRNPLPPGGDQREIRLLQDLGKRGQGRDPTPPPDLPPQSPHHHLLSCLTRAHPGAPPSLISLHLCHFSSLHSLPQSLS